MQLCFAVTNDLSTDQRMQRICSRLSKAGYQVKLVGRRLPESWPLESGNYRQKRLKCWFRKGFLFYAEFNCRLFFYLLRTKADVLCAVDLDTVAAVGLAAFFRKKKWTFDAHEYFIETPEVTGRPRVKWFWAWLGRRFVPKCSLAYTVGAGLASIFSEEYKIEFHTIRNLPMNDMAVIPSPQSGEGRGEVLDEPIILYQGALNRSRGLEELILAMHQINAVCWLAGTGDLDKELIALVKQEKLDDKVKFLGRQSPVELREITAKATIGYNVLRNEGLSYYHSLSNKFFDYIRAGVPSLSPPFPEYEKLLAEYHVGLTCECEPEKIKIALNNMLQNPALMEQMKQNCKAAAQELNWENESKKLIALYANLR